MLAIVLLFVSLGLDTLAVSLGLGLSGLPRRLWLRIGLTFAVCEGGMPLIGLLIGRQLSTSAGVWAGYLAAAILIVVGALAIREAFEDEPEASPTPETRGWSLLWMGLSVSLDEMAVGFSLGVVHAALGFALGFIAIQAFVLTFAGLWLGSRLKAHLGSKAELASGIILCLLGIAMVVEQASGRSFL